MTPKENPEKEKWVNNNLDYGLIAFRYVYFGNVAPLITKNVLNNIRYKIHFKRDYI